MNKKRVGVRGALIAVLFALMVMGCGMAKTPTSLVDPGAVIVEAKLSTPILLSTGQSSVYARIRIATAPRPARPRGPVNLALAIDTSGSMAGAAIKDAKAAAVRMIDSLKDGDRLAVVVFHSKTEVLLPSTELDGEVRANTRSLIEKIVAQGTTDMGQGLESALQEVQSHAGPKGINRVILLGDGIPNNVARIEPTIQRAASQGIAITAMGLGLDYDETLMGHIADVSGGKYRYIEDSNKVAGFFNEELERLDLIYGRNMGAKITAGPGVQIESVVGGDAPTDGRATYLNLGDISRGDTRDILVRMTVTPRKAGVSIELLDVAITFDDAVENAGRLERSVYLGAETTTDNAKVVKSKNSEVEQSAALAEASAITLRALALSQAGLHKQARDLLTSGAEAATTEAKRTKSAALESQAAKMVAVASDMPTADVPTAPAPRPRSDPGYSFEDDPLNSESVAPASANPPISPAASKMRKEIHQSAYDALH